MADTMIKSLAGMIGGKTGSNADKIEEFFHFLPHLSLVGFFGSVVLERVLFTLKLLPPALQKDIGTVWSTTLSTFPVSEVAKAVPLDKDMLANIFVGALLIGVLLLIFTRKQAKFAAGLFAVTLLHLSYVFAVKDVKLPGVAGFGLPHNVVIGAIEVIQVALFASALYVIYHKDHALIFYLQYLKHLVDEKRGVVAPRASKKASASPKKSAAPARDASPAPAAAKSASPKKAGSPKKNN